MISSNTNGYDRLMPSCQHMTTCMSQAMNVGDLWYLCKTMIIIIHTNTPAVNYDGPTVI